MSFSSTRSEEHTSELQSHLNLVCRLLLEKKHTTGGRATPRRRGPPRTHPARPPPSLPASSAGWISTLRQLFFFNDTATTEIYTLSLHDALPIFFSSTVYLPYQEVYSLPYSDEDIPERERDV